MNTPHHTAGAVEPGWVCLLSPLSQHPAEGTKLLGGQGRAVTSACRRESGKASQRKEILSGISSVEEEFSRA